MRSHRLGTLAWIAISLIPMGARSQTPFSMDAEKAKAATSAIGGRTAIDLVRIEGSGFGIPLKNGGIITASEQIDLDGRTLKRGEDYSFDYASGTIYLMRTPRPGQALRASYRFDPEKSKGLAGSAFVNGINGFTFNLLPGASLMLGLGMTERLADGTVTTSNLYGLHNSFSFGHGGLNGLFVVGERKQVQAQSLYDFEDSKALMDTGKSQAMLQKLGTKALGGEIEADYQDIRQNFNGFQAFQNAGYEKGFVDQLQKEKGLKRVGLGFKDIGGAGLKLSQSYRQVSDDTGSIEWRSLGIKTGGLQLNWTGQKVDPLFNRFKDIAEADRDQLSKERGLDRQTIQGALSLKGGKGSFDSLKVEDQDGKGIYRRSIGLDLNQFKFGFSDQIVDAGFSRFGNLREADAGQLAREAGLRRQSFNLAASPGKANSILFGSSVLRTDTGDYKAQDLHLQSNKWTLEQHLRGADKGLTALGSLADPEIVDHMKAIGKLYDAGEIPIKPEEKNAFLQSAGLERSGLRLAGPIGKSLNATFETLHLSGEKDSGQIIGYRLASPKFNLAYKRQDFGAELTELSKLMEFERLRIGSLPGLARTDFDLSAILSRDKKLSYSQMHAGIPEGAASRQTFAYQDKGFDLTYARRSVDAGFNSVGQLVDPEKELLNVIKGFDQTEFKLGWQVFKGFRLDSQISDARNDTLHENRSYRNALVGWKFDKFTQIDWMHLDQRDDDPTHLLLANKIDRFGISRNFGKYGALAYSQEEKAFDGMNSNQPNSKKETLSYETKINAKTAVKTEQTRTEYSNGDKEDISANTVSTELGKRTGVSVTDVSIDRTGSEKPDEKKRNYGFWWDFGNGLRLDYGYARSLIEEQHGEMQSSVSLSPGQVGDVKIDSASYQTHRWDDSRNQAIGNLQLGTKKPLQIGFLRDLSFRFAADTSRDRDAWLKENRNFALGTRVGSNSFKYEYLSQMAPNGCRAIDRAFAMSTDQNPNRFLNASISYKLRTLPDNDQVMIRDYTITLRPSKGIELTHKLITNPEIARGDVILGSLPQASRSNKWELGFNHGVSTKAKLSWEELINDQAHSLSRVAGVNVTLFANNPSPLTLFYGLEQTDVGYESRSIHRYSLRFDQRPGPNQLLSIFAGNVSYQGTRSDDVRLQNWTVRMEYQIKF